MLDEGFEIDLSSPEAGPKPVVTLRSRKAALSAADRQLAVLDAVPLPGGDFDEALCAAGLGDLRPAPLEIVQVNIGKLCNMTCRHCHVDAGPDRTENMTQETIDLVLAALDKTDAHTVDITGGAPELNPHFRYLVDQCVARGKHVIDRCNLTVLLLPRFAELPGWFAERGVEVVCSLPHHRQRNTDRQRGDGTYERSIEALQRLNAVGYGQGDPERILTLMMNPAGAFLAPEQRPTEDLWRASLAQHHGVSFDRLIALNNMPISRFLDWLEQSNNLDPYLHKLVEAFNPSAVGGLMCRNAISVSWDGQVYDCDFNQMLELPTRGVTHVRDFDPQRFASRRILTARHCFGCTAGAGSSCGGSTA